jgi:hypothetical protein
VRYKVPQNIDMEDRIVGPLTMVQFVTVMIGGGLVYLSYTVLTPSTFWFVAIPVAIVTLALAFLKVNDQPFPKFAASAMLFIVRPKKRIWQKTDNAETLTIVHKPNMQAVRMGAESTVKRSQLEQLSTVLDTGGTTPIPTTAPPTLNPSAPEAAAVSQATTTPTIAKTIPAANDEEIIATDRLGSLKAASGAVAAGTGAETAISPTVEPSTIDHSWGTS